MHSSMVEIVQMEDIESVKWIMSSCLHDIIRAKIFFNYFAQRKFTDQGNNII